MSILDLPSPSQRLISSLLQVPGVSSASIQDGSGISTSRLDISYQPSIQSGGEEKALLSISLPPRLSDSELRSYLTVMQETMKRIMDFTCTRLPSPPPALGSSFKESEGHGTTTSESLEKTPLTVCSSKQAVVLPFPQRTKRDWKPFDPSAA